MKKSTNSELLYYDTLTRIAKHYDTAARIQATAEDRYGLSPVEALEMAYENVQADAARAISGKRRPKEDAP